ncbi:MAG: hypothetical protein J6D44_08485, partial [Pseudomonas sp.]|nr:hypothetical protein [Pseudomonas sp.]
NEAAFGGEAVVKSGCAVFQVNPITRIYERFALGRSLVPSAAATKSGATTSLRLTFFSPHT